MKNGLPGEQNLYNKGFRLEITHLPTNYSVAFSAFLEQFSDAYNSEWSVENPYGRMDPIGTFISTKRAISISWKIPASSRMQAKDNLDKVNKVVSFLYPLYSKSGVSQATTINMGPLWKVKFGNLICNSLTGGPLMGWVNGITVDPLFEEGTFMLDSGVSDTSTATAAAGGVAFGEPTPSDAEGANIIIDSNPNRSVSYYPKTIRLNVEMTVVHEHSVGWRLDNDGQYIFRGKTGKYGTGQSFPYPSDRKVKDQIDESELSLNDVRNIPIYNPLQTKSGPGEPNQNRQDPISQPNAAQVAFLKLGEG